MKSLEEQAITTSSYELRIWKRFVDDTFTILDSENVDDYGMAYFSLSKNQFSCRKSINRVRYCLPLSDLLIVCYFPCLYLPSGFRLIAVLYINARVLKLFVTIKFVIGLIAGA